MKNIVGKQNWFENAVYGIVGLIAFTFIALLLYGIGILFNFAPFKLGFESQFWADVNYPLFIACVIIFKIMIGGAIIDNLAKIIFALARRNQTGIKAPEEKG